MLGQSGQVFGRAALGRLWGFSGYLRALLGPCCAVLGVYWGFMMLSRSHIKPKSLRSKQPFQTLRCSISSSFSGLRRRHLWGPLGSCLGPLRDIWEPLGGPLAVLGWRWGATSCSRREAALGCLEAERSAGRQNQGGARDVTRGAPPLESARNPTRQRHATWQYGYNDQPKRHFAWLLPSFLYELRV